MPRLLFAIAAALLVAACNEPPTDFRECPPGVDPGSFDCVFPRPERDTGATQDVAADDADTGDGGVDVGAELGAEDDTTEGSGTMEAVDRLDIDSAGVPCVPGDGDCPDSSQDPGR